MKNQLPVTTMRYTTLPSGEAVPILGQGTWKMGENSRRRDEEIAALRYGLDLGMTLIDTAEMYADGAAEEIVGRAVAGRRDETFIVSKFYPYNATQKGMVAACERSLKRLQTDRIDLYLLHWKGTTPLRETINGFNELLASGKIRYWGVSNFDLADMEELVKLPSDATVATNQVLYNLMRRGAEWDLLPWCHRQNIPVMAYSPIEQGVMLNNRALETVATGHGATPAQIALAWLLRQKGIIAIPKASRTEHLLENRAALEIELSQADLSTLDKAFPPPKGPEDLEMI